MDDKKKAMEEFVAKNVAEEIASRQPERDIIDFLLDDDDEDEDFEELRMIRR